MSPYSFHYEAIAWGNSAALCVIDLVDPSIPLAFTLAKRQLIETLGNTYITFGSNGETLPYEINGLLETRIFKEYTRRLIKTLDDVSYLKPDYFIANKNTPTNLMKVWDLENSYIQNQQVGAVIYLTSVNDPVTRIIRSL